MSKLVLETGVKSYEIYNEKDELLGTINIYGTDLGIATRAREAQERIENLIEGAQKLAEENPTEGEILDEIKALDVKIKGELDYMFNADISNTVFKNLNCLSVSPNTGKYFVEGFMDMIIPVIKKEHADGIKKSEKRMSKYTDLASKRK